MRRGGRRVGKEGEGEASSVWTDASRLFFCPILWELGAVCLDAFAD